MPGNSGTRSHRIEFSGFDLNGIELNGLELSGTKFSGLESSGIKFSRLDLSRGLEFGRLVVQGSGFEMCRSSGVRGWEHRSL